MFKRVAGGQSIRQASKWARDLEPAQRGEYVDENGGFHPARPLSFQRIREILSSPRYIAREPREDAADILTQPLTRWPALVNDATWAAVQERISSHKRQPRQASNRFLLTGHIWCPRCRDQKRDVRMCGLAAKRGANRYLCLPALRGGCDLSVQGEKVNAAILRQIAALVECLTDNDPRHRAAVHRAWDRLRQPDDEADLQRRRDIRAAERRLTEAQRRLVAAGHLLTDGTLGAKDYAALRDDLMATIDEAETTLATLRAVKSAPALPPLDQVVRAAGGWGEIVSGADIQAQRLILSDLVERVYPVRVAYATYDAEITWTQLGEALQQLRQSVAAA
jgi:hypothetical protein